MIYSFFRLKIPKISPFFHCGILLLICCNSAAQNKPDLVPTSVSEDFRAGHGNILYVENAIHQVKIIYYVHNDYYCYFWIIKLIKYFSLITINSLKVGKKLLLPKSWQGLVAKIEEGRTNLDEDTDELASPG